MALCSMVGGGTNLSLCASLLVEGTRGRSLAIGFTSNKLGDDRSITASCSVKFFLSISVTNPSAADVSSLQMDSWKRRLRARQCRLSARRKYFFGNPTPLLLRDWLIDWFGVFV